MKYIKLFLPLIIGLAINTLWEINFQKPDPTVTTILKFGLLIYYLRLDNSGTPLINTLTGTIIFMGIGEYFLKNYQVLGQILYGLSAFAFGTIYFLRQTQKQTKDRLLKIKVLAVIIFSLLAIATLKLPTLIPFTIASILLMLIYFYDRLTSVRQTR